jgi:clan AA aspartic protease
MGLLRTTIELVNTYDFLQHRKKKISAQEIKRVKVNALVDSGAIMLAINENVRTQLDLDTLERRTATLADGSVMDVDVVGPVDIRFENRQCTTRALVLPRNAECLLGAIPIKDMDLVIDLNEQKLVVHPDHSIKAQMSLKGALQLHPMTLH